MQAVEVQYVFLFCLPNLRVRLFAVKLKAVAVTKGKCTLQAGFNE